MLLHILWLNLGHIPVIKIFLIHFLIIELIPIAHLKLIINSIIVNYFILYYTSIY